MGLPEEQGAELAEAAAERGTDTPQKSLRHTTARGFVWSFASSGGQAVLQIVSLAVLGRLLTPAQFGVVAAAMLVVGFTSTIGQLGVAPALVQKPKLTLEQTGAGIVVSILTSAVLATIVWFLIPVVAPILGLPAGSPELHLLVIAIPLTGLAAVPLGLMQRALRFRQLASVDILAYALGVVGLSILLAALGFGTFALVWGQIATVAIQAIGYWIIARVKVRISAPRQLARESGELLNFGLPYSIGQIGNWIAGNGDNFVVATQLHSVALGVYSRAFQLLAAPANLIGGVADRVLFPAMAAVQNDKQRIMRAYATSSAFVALITVPASVVLFSGAGDLVGLLLGPNWGGVVAPLQVFALALLPRTSYKISGSFTRARGAVRGGAVRQWVYAVEVVVFCTIGSHWGVFGVAIGASVAILSHYLIMVQYSAQVAPGLWRMLGRAYLRYIPYAIACVLFDVVALFAISWLHIGILRLIVLTIAVGIGAALVLFLFRKQFGDELSLVTTIIRRRGAKAATAGSATATPATATGTQPDATSGDTPGTPDQKPTPSA